MGKAVKSIANVATLGAAGGLDLFGDKAAAAEKKASEQAAADAAALAATQSTAPTLASDDVAAAREAERLRKLALSGQSSTILTGAQGAGTTATAGVKTLLGS